MNGYEGNRTLRGDHIAIRSEERSLTYAQLHDRASRLAQVLAAEGLSEGDRLAIMMPNLVEFVECLASSAKLGCAALSVNFHLAPAELAHVLNDSQASMLIAHVDLKDVVAAAEPACPVIFVGDKTTDGYEARLASASSEPVEYLWPAPWPVIYTSGTTGRPKGVVHGALASAEVLAYSQNMLTQMWGYTEQDIHLVAGPLYHGGPQGYANLTLFAGGTVVLMDKWDAREFCRLVEQYQVTTTFLTPAHFIRLLELPPQDLAEFDLTSLRHVLHAGAPCPVSVKLRMIDALPQAEIWEFYGMSEGGATRVSPEQFKERPGTVGPPWPGVELQILDPDTKEVLPAGQTGLVYVKPSFGRFHYHEDEAKTEEAWIADSFTVGDIGHLDSDGWLYLTDRHVDLVIKGGVNIYPRQIEEVLHQHPQVVDCAVFGIPNERDGEHLHAVVELRPSQSQATPQELQEFCASHLDRWSCPDSFEIIDQLPRDPNGKVLKRVLRQQAWSEAGRNI